MKERLAGWAKLCSANLSKAGWAELGLAGRAKQAERGGASSIARPKLCPTAGRRRKMSGPPGRPGALESWAKVRLAGRAKVCLAGLLKVCLANLAKVRRAGRRERAGAPWRWTRDGARASALFAADFCPRACGQKAAGGWAKPARRAARPGAACLRGAVPLARTLLGGSVFYGGFDGGDDPAGDGFGGGSAFGGGCGGGDDPAGDGFGGGSVFYGGCGGGDDPAGDGFGGGSAFGGGCGGVYDGGGFGGADGGEEDGLEERMERTAAAVRAAFLESFGREALRAEVESIVRAAVISGTAEVAAEGVRRAAQHGARCARPTSRRCWTSGRGKG